MVTAETKLIHGFVMACHSTSGSTSSSILGPQEGVPVVFAAGLSSQKQ